jgi:hypothetical protein
LLGYASNGIIRQNSILGRQEVLVMTVLATFHGRLEKNGVVRLDRDPELPEGTEVVVVVAQHLSIAEQERRLAALSPEEWHRPFDEFTTAVASDQPEVNIADISDEELVELVREARQESA